MKKIVVCFVTVSLFFSSAYTSTFPTDHPPGRTAPWSDLDAHELFYTMLDQSIHLEARELYVVGSDRTIPVSFGAEKEGSSSKILRVMSPSADLMKRQLPSFPKEALSLIEGVISGTALIQSPVLDMNGKQQKVDRSEIRGIRMADVEKLKRGFDSATGNFSNSEIHSEFYNVFNRVIAALGPSPFSHLKPSVRKHLWSLTAVPGDHKTRVLGYYDNWVPLFGDAEKYIHAGHKELNAGWEVIFKPQNTYADFEKQISWFRQLMGSGTALFEAPGHNRVVMPRIQLTPEQDEFFKGKAGELSRMIQAYIVLRGIKGRTKVLGGKYKSIISDYALANLESWRGPIRLEQNRFYQNSIGVEFRAGMKDEVVRRFTQAIYVSRMASNQMQDMASIQDYSLSPDPTSSDMFFDSNYKAGDYGVSEDLLRAAIANWSSVVQKGGRSVGRDYMLPLWLWWKAPFLSGKERELKRLSVEFINRLAAMENPTYDKLEKLSADWVSASNILADIENYLIPKKSMDRVASPLMVEVKPGQIDVNKIDLGNEFTARMPLKLKADYNHEGKWVQTIYDMTPEERQAKIRSVAETLQARLGGGNLPVVPLDSGSHGHSLSIAYNLTDGQGRTWRVEWDGVSRNYDADGNVLPETARGGHIEIVSPKYNPSMAEIESVYQSIEEHSLVPDYKMGGSHINIDLAAFDGKPKQLARFLALFHQHRGIISFMFQHINRLRSAEPVDVSANLDQQLRQFSGSEEDLAKLLYNEKYFNDRLNRKTRYTQIDVSNYMGPVIPAHLIAPDFDVVKARFTGGEGWSRQFRVTKHRKLEFRLFDAAKDPLEAALQIKLVRALLHKALNDSSPVSKGPQAVDHEAYVRQPGKAFQDLRAMLADLNLPYLDYSPYVTNKLVINKAFMAGKYYENWFVRANREYPKVDGWFKARAVARRGALTTYSEMPEVRPIKFGPSAPVCRMIYR